jgi:hypothetical protein
VATRPRSTSRRGTLTLHTVDMCSARVCAPPFDRGVFVWLSCRNLWW